MVDNLNPPWVTQEFLDKTWLEFQKKIKGTRFEGMSYATWLQAGAPQDLFSAAIGDGIYTPPVANMEVSNQSQVDSDAIDIARYNNQYIPTQDNTPIPSDPFSGLGDTGNTDTAMPEYNFDKYLATFKPQIVAEMKRIAETSPWIITEAFINPATGLEEFPASQTAKTDEEIFTEAMEHYNALATPSPNVITKDEFASTFPSLDTGTLEGAYNIYVQSNGDYTPVESVSAWNAVFPKEETKSTLGNTNEQWWKQKSTIAADRERMAKESIDSATNEALSGTTPAWLRNFMTEQEFSQAAENERQIANNFANIRNAAETTARMNEIGALTNEGGYNQLAIDNPNQANWWMNTATNAYQGLANQIGTNAPSPESYYADVAALGVGNANKKWYEQNGIYQTTWSVTPELKPTTASWRSKTWNLSAQDYNRLSPSERVSYDKYMRTMGDTWKNGARGNISSGGGYSNPFMQR